MPPVDELFGHTEEEGHFFMLLVLYGRSGTKTLEKYFKKQIDEILAKRSVFMERVSVDDEIPAADQAVYYSQWYYLAIHLLIGIPGFQTKDALAERLNLSPQLISKALDQLAAMGLVESRGAKLVKGKKRIHIDKNSPWVSQMHAQFRNRGIYRLSNPESNDLHFSFGMGITRKVFEEYRQRIMDLVVEFEPKLVASAEEDLFALNIDLFRF